MTIGNAKAVDIYAEKDNKRIAIQVKSIYKKKNVGFPIMTNKVRDDCFYIFVNLNADKMIMPDYFICTSEEVRCRIKQYANRGIINLSSLKSDNFHNNWLKLE